jgi:hypothetical protein
MSMGDIGSITSAIVALVALIISIVSMNKANKFGSTADRLNQILIEREQAEEVASKKADLSANMIKTGKSDARNVRLIDLAGDCSIIIANDIQRKFPLTLLEQHQSVELIAVVTLSGSRSSHIKLQWDDETGVNHEKELKETV